MKELKEACGSSYSITATLPTSYCTISRFEPSDIGMWLIPSFFLTGYLKGFDVKALSEYVDYFNFMSYDIHGTWDGNTKWTESVVNPHTNLTGEMFLPQPWSSALTTCLRNKGRSGSPLAK